MQYNHITCKSILNRLLVLHFLDRGSTSSKLLLEIFLANSKNHSLAWKELKQKLLIFKIASYATHITYSESTEEWKHNF